MNKHILLVPAVLIELVFYGLGSILAEVPWRKSEEERDR